MAKTLADKLKAARARVARLEHQAAKPPHEELRAMSRQKEELDAYPRCGRNWAVYQMVGRVF